MLELIYFFAVVFDELIDEGSWGSKLFDIPHPSDIYLFPNINKWLVGLDQFNYSKMSNKPGRRLMRSLITNLFTNKYQMKI